MRIRIKRVCAIAALGIPFALAVAGSAAAHTVQLIGPYSVTIGWLREPPYVGELNAVQFLVHDASGPVDGITTHTLSLVVSTGSAQSDPLAFAPTFDEDTGLGLPGEYLAPIIPTAPGDYTFHLTGKIGDTPIDLTVSSSESTFDAAVAPTAIQFPVALPALGDVTSRLEGVDSRIETAQGAATDAAAKADNARSAVSQSMLIGLGAGGLGILVGIVALVIAVRKHPPAAG